MCEHLEITHFDSLKVLEETPKFVKFLTSNLIATDTQVLNFDLANSSVKQELNFTQSQEQVEYFSISDKKSNILIGGESFVSDTEGAVSAPQAKFENVASNADKSLTVESIEVQDVIQAILSDVEISNQYFHNDSKDILHLESNPGEQSLSIPVHIVNTNLVNHNLSFNLGHAFFDGSQDLSVISPMSFSIWSEELKSSPEKTKDVLETSNAKWVVVGDILDRRLRIDKIVANISDFEYYITDDLNLPAEFSPDFEVPQHSVYNSDLALGACSEPGSADSIWKKWLPSSECKYLLVWHNKSGSAKLDGLKSIQFFGEILYHRQSNSSIEENEKQTISKIISNSNSKKSVILRFIERLNSSTVTDPLDSSQLDLLDAITRLVCHNLTEGCSVLFEGLDLGNLLENFLLKSSEESLIFKI